MQAPLVTFSPRAHAAAAQASAQAGQPNGTGQAGFQTTSLHPGSVRLDPLGRPMSIDHEHQVCLSPAEHFSTTFTSPLGSTGLIFHTDLVLHDLLARSDCCSGCAPVCCRHCWRQLQRVPMGHACHVSSRVAWALPAWRGPAATCRQMRASAATCSAASIPGRS